MVLKHAILTPVVPSEIFLDMHEIRTSGKACMQVLVVFLGEQFSHWQSPAQLLPYRPYEAEKILAASELKHGGQMPRYNYFQKGTEVASLDIS